MLFPRPLSSRQVVRLNISRTIADTGGLYGRVLSGIEDRAESSDKADAKATKKEHRERFLKIMVSSMYGLMKLIFSVEDASYTGADVIRLVRSCRLSS